MRKTEDAGELFEFLIQRVDRRTDLGKIAEATLTRYKEANNTNALSLVKALVMELQTDNLAHVLTLDDEYYKTAIKGKEQCICGKELTKEVFLMSYKPGTLAQEQIVSVIRTGKPIKGTRDYIPLGSSCHKRLPYIFEDLGEPRLRKRIEEGPKKQEKKLEEIISALSPELEEKLEKYGIDTEQLGKIISLEHTQALIKGDESGLKFDLDPGTNRNTYNWFREDIKIGDIKNEEVKYIWGKINRAAHLVTEEELATMMVYSHEFRQRNTDVLLAGVKEDLLFLSSLSKNHQLIKKYGEVNIDRHFVLPKTVYRSRKGLPKRTIRDVLEQEKITRVEAMGVHRHFPNIVERRIEINREIAQNYGVGRSWDYILKEIRPIFEQVKAGLAEEYRKWGEIIKEYVLTKDEYLAVKGFLKRSSIGKESERENYLRNYHIKAFLAVAPKIVIIGRKLRYAIKLEEKKNELSKYDVLRQEYVLKEDFLKNFKEWTSIEEDADRVIDMIANARFVKNKNFLKFQEKRGVDVKEIYDEGIIAKKYLGELKFYYNLLKKEGVKEINEAIIQKLNDIKGYINLPFIEYYGDFPVKELGKIRFISKNGTHNIDLLHSNLEFLLYRLELKKEDLAGFNSEKFNEDLTLLEKKGEFVYIKRGEGTAFLDDILYNAKSMKISVRDISAYNIKKIDEIANNLRSAIEVDNKFLTKLRELNNENSLKLLGIDKKVAYSSYLKEKDIKKFFVSKGFKQELEQLYEKLQEYISSADARKRKWANERSEKRWILSKELSEKIYNALVRDNSEILEIINGTVGGYLRAEEGRKRLVRFHKYTAERHEKYGELNFKRFMGDGEKPINWDKLASGEQARFGVHLNIKQYLKMDWGNRLISEGKYNQCLRRIEQFENDVNRIIQQRYGR